MGLNLNNVYQRPYVLKDGKNFVKQKQDEERSAAQADQESSKNSKSRGLQYTEENSQNSGWQKVRDQIQSRVRQTPVQSPVQPKTASDVTQNTAINIAQILKDFRNTAVAIGTPQDLKDEVEGYLGLIEKQVTKDNPNTRLVKSNLKNASTILDKYISETLSKDSKVVENWVDALFLQRINYKYNPEDINPQFSVKFPEGTTPAAQPTEAQPVEPKPDLPVQEDKELKSLFVQAKKLSFANDPKKSIETYQKALNRAVEVGDSDTESKVYFEVGKIYDDYGYLPQALTSYYEAVTSTDDPQIRTKAHFSMGQIYDESNMINPALDHYFVSIANGGEAENLVAQSTSLAKVGNIYKDMYEHESLDYYSLADGLASQTDNARVKGYVSSGLGAAYEKFGEPQEALKAFGNAVKYYDEAKSPQRVAQNYVNAAEIMLDYNSTNKAKGLLKKAQVYAGQADDIELMSKISEKINKLAA